jgi:hypothetical protein
MTDENAQTEDQYVFYARVWPRMKALLIDGVVLAAVFLAAAVIGANVTGAGAAAFLVWSKHGRISNAADRNPPAPPRATQPPR